MTSKRATSIQYSQLINLIEECETLRFGKGSPETKKAAWEEIKDKLNSIGGAVKTAEGWKKFCYFAFTELTKVEEQCARVTGLYVTTSEIPDFPELGDPQTQHPPPTITKIVEADHDEPEEDELAEIPESETEAEVITVQIDDNPNEASTAVNAKKKKKPKTTRFYLDEQIKATSDGLQAIANSILHVAEAINGLSIAITTNLKKTTIAQYELYIGYKKQGNDTESLFETLCMQLNKEENAPHRTPAQWRMAFSKWEARVKAKARRIQYEQELTGGGIPILEILTKLELKLLAVLSKVLIYGLPGIIELGCQQQKPMLTWKTNSIKKRRKYIKKLPKAIQNSHSNTILLKNSIDKIKQSINELKKALFNLNSIFLAK